MQIRAKLRRRAAKTAVLHGRCAASRHFFVIRDRRCELGPASAMGNFMNQIYELWARAVCLAPAPPLVTRATFARHGLRWPSLRRFVGPVAEQWPQWARCHGNRTGHGLEDWSRIQGTYAPRTSAPIFDAAKPWHTGKSPVSAPQRTVLRAMLRRTPVRLSCRERPGAAAPTRAPENTRHAQTQCELLDRPGRRRRGQSGRAREEDAAGKRGTFRNYVSGEQQKHTARIEPAPLECKIKEDRNTDRKRRDKKKTISKAEEMKQGRDAETSTPNNTARQPLHYSIDSQLTSNIIQIRRWPGAKSA